MLVRLTAPAGEGIVLTRTCCPANANWRGQVIVSAEPRFLTVGYRKEGV